MTAIVLLNTYPIEESEKTLILVSVSDLLNKRIMAEQMNPELFFCKLKKGIEMENKKDDLEAEVTVNPLEIELKKEELLLCDKQNDLLFEEKKIKL